MNPDKIRSRLRRGEGVIISEVFSNRTGLTVGDTFRPGLKRPWLNYRFWEWCGIIVPRAVWSFIPCGISRRAIMILAGAGCGCTSGIETRIWTAAVADLRKKIIERWGGDLDMISGEDLRASILRVFDETFAVTTVLVAHRPGDSGIGNYHDPDGSGIGTLPAA